VGVGPALSEAEVVRERLFDFGDPQDTPAGPLGPVVVPASIRFALRWMGF